MKLTKIFAIALAAATMTACSDDDNGWNTKSGVTVDFENATMDITEDKSFFEIPVVVTGETNGDIKVTIEVETPSTVDDYTAVENEQYMITSYSIVIPKGSASKSFEVRNLWEQGVVTPDKTFTVKLAKVEGATAGAVASSAVTIVNIDNTYTGLLGRWTISYDNLSTGEAVEEQVTFSLPSYPEPEDEGHLVCAFGINNNADMYLPIWFDINENNGEVEYVGIPLDFLSSDYIWNFGAAVGKALLVSSQLTANGFVQEGFIEGEINDDHTEIVFNNADPFVQRLVAYPSYEYLDYTFGGKLANIVLTKN